MNSDKRFVIVGAGQAGSWAARTLREQGFDGRLQLIGAERHLPYERPPLSKAILAGKLPAESARLLDEAAMTALNIEFSPSMCVAEIDVSAKLLRTDSGEEIPYDKVLLATGGRAAVLPITGTDLPGVHTLRTLDDAQRLQATLTPGKHIVILGGGWIGLETAATARELGCEVTVVEFASHVCARSLPREVAQWLEAVHRANGVEIRLSTQVTALTKRADNTLNVELIEGSIISADAVVLGTGMLPNDELAQRAGLACDRGVLVDVACRTSDPHIHAAGDVAVFETAHDTAARRLESWQNAQDQGISAAMSMLGKAATYKPLPLIWSEQYQYMIQIAGHTSSTQTVLHRSLGGDAALFLSVDDQDRAIAVVGINAGRTFRVARKWVDERAVINRAALVDSGIAIAAAIAASQSAARPVLSTHSHDCTREQAN